MRERCVSTVRGLRVSWAAMSRLVRPVAASLAISRSRPVSVASGPAGWPGAPGESVARVAGRLANAHYRHSTSHDALGELADMAEGDPALAPGAASPGTLTWWEGLLLLLYAEGSYTKMVTLGRSLARAGRAADDSQMQAIGTRVEGGALIHLGRLAEGAALRPSRPW